MSNFSPGFWAQRHVRSLVFLVLVLTVGGTLATFVNPTALFPAVSFPRVQVSLDAGDRPAERMLLEVTAPAEEALRSIPGVSRVRSVTSRGAAEVNVDFDWGHDMTAALLQVQGEVARLLPNLPAGSAFTARRMNPTVFPVIAYSLTSDGVPLTKLQDLARYQIRPSLLGVAGVAEVGVQGGETAEVQVIADPLKLAARGLTIADVANALSAANVLTAVGRVEQDDKLYLAVADATLETLDEVRAVVLRRDGNGVVRVEDVADVREGSEPQYVRVTADGHDAVLVQVYQQPAGNTVAIAGAVAAKLDALKKTLPPGVTVANWYDQSELILASAKGTRDAILIGSGLAALVLLAFLRNIKVTLIAVLAVPAVLAATALLLYALGLSFNIMTLGGMAAAVGLILDDAIVMVEHLVRRLRTPAGRSAPDATIAAADDEFARPLVGSSLSTIVIHVPPAFLIGVAGAFFGELSLTVATALIVSFGIAWLVIPAVAGRVLSAKDAAKHDEPGRVGRWVDDAYTRSMRGLLAVPWLVLPVVAVVLGLGYLAYERVPTGFMPSTDEGGFILDYVAPPGTSLAETDRLLQQVEAILRDTPEVRTYSRRTGLQLGGGLSEANIGDFFVRLKPYPRRPIGDVMDDVRGRIEGSIPNLQVELLQLMEDLIGDLTAVPQPVEVKIYGDDEAKLDQAVADVAAVLETVPNLIEVAPGVVTAGDGVDIKVDLVKAAAEGIDPQAVTALVGDALAGNVATQISRPPKLVGVRVWLPSDTRQTIDDLRNLQLRAPDGHAFPLKRVATLTPVVGQPEIAREDLRRMASVTARTSTGGLGAAVAAARKAVENSNAIPPGMTFEMGGLYAQQQVAFRGMVGVIVAAAMLVFLLLLYLYESLRVAASILFAAVLSMAAVFAGLWVTGTELNITALMGMVMIVGNVTEVAVFYLNELRELPPEAGDDGCDRLILAGRGRLRAILMTTLAAILALLPLAYGVGEGSGLLQPLAVSIISGLLVQLPLVLILLPMLLVSLQPARR